MCGITGAIWTDPRRAVDEPTLRRMTELLRHRGPDDEGFYYQSAGGASRRGTLPGVALGFRRLAIIDLETGHQPMCNEDESVWVVFNGEIYNYRELRRRLEATGHQFRTHSDTETIVHLYEDEGPDCVRHFNGMFAMAIWDQRRGRLLLARDRLGQKPLVYRHDAGRLLFASELKSLLAVDDVPRQIDPTSLDMYLTYQYVPYPRSIFVGTAKLPPGHLAVYEDDRLEVRPYWQPDFSQEQAIPLDEAEHQLQERLTSSVQLRLRSDVPLGAFLSGGVDSSLIVALMQKQSEQPVRTFSIGFPVAEYDETKHAAHVARHLGTEHREFVVTPDGLDILPKLIWHYDEPFADSSAIPTWYVSQMTRQEVTVALSGDGGDELFAGYPRYRAVWLADQLGWLGPIKRLLGAPFWQRLPGARHKSLLRRFKRFSEFLGMPPAQRYLQWIAIYSDLRRAELYEADFLATLPDEDPCQFVSRAWDRAGRRDAVTAASIADVTTYLPCDILHKVDMASMAHGLECRQPFLDHRVVELAASLPVTYKFRWGRGKWLLKKTFGSLLPKEIWQRPKMGFGVPLDHWFRNELRELVEDVLLSQSCRERGYFHAPAIERMLREHQNHVTSHAYRLWALLVFELWMRRWCDGGPSSTMP